MQTRFFGRPRAARPVIGPFSEALSATSPGVRLTLVEPEHPAMDRGRRGAFSLLSTAALNGFDPRRFRMLFGVDGIPAHAEDDWIGERVRIGDAVVRPFSGTGRCLVTSQDPDTGVADMDMLGPHPRVPARRPRRAAAVRRPRRGRAVGHGPPRRSGGAAVTRQSTPRSIAQRDSSWRVESCSLRRTDETCASTVLAEMPRRSAISL